MTIFLCKCGNTKTGQPYRRADTKPWMCEKCRPALGRPVVTITKVQAKVFGIRISSPKARGAG